MRIPGWNISHSPPPTRFASTVPTTLLTVNPIEILKLRRRSSAASAKHSTLTLMYTVYTTDGNHFDLHLDANEIKWYEI